MKNILLILFCSLSLVGCGAGRLTVLDPLECDEVALKIKIQRTKDTVKTNPERVEEFESLLRKELRNKGAIEGSDITLSYRFVQVNEGNRFGRWLTGGIGNLGEGSLTIEVKYINRQGREIGRIMSEGKIGSGLWGGGFSNALEKAAEEIAQYTAKSLNIGCQS